MAPLCRDGAHRNSRLQGVSDGFVVEKLDPSIEASGSESAPGWAQPIRKWGRLRPSSEPDHGAARLRHRSVTTWRLAPRPNLALAEVAGNLAPLAPLRVRTPRREIGSYGRLRLVGRVTSRRVAACERGRAVPNGCHLLAGVEATMLDEDPDLKAAITLRRKRQRHSAASAELNSIDDRPGFVHDTSLLRMLCRARWRRGTRRVDRTALGRGCRRRHLVRLVALSHSHRLPAAGGCCPSDPQRRTTWCEIEASLCQDPFRGASKQRRGRGRSVVFGSGSDLLRSAGVQGSAGHAGLESRP
jgi:hypothetical protein